MLPLYVTALKHFYKEELDEVLQMGDSLKNLLEKSAKLSAKMAFELEHANKEVLSDKMLDLFDKLRECNNFLQKTVKDVEKEKNLEDSKNGK